jgi:hypothetical protein
MIFLLFLHPIGIFGTSQPSVRKYCTLCNVITTTKFMPHNGLIKFVLFPQIVPFRFVLLVLVHSTYFMNNIIIITNRL